MNKRTACLLAASLMLPACDRVSHPLGVIGPLDPSPAVAGTILPQPIALTPVTGVSCAFLTPFTTAFDLVIDHRGPGDLFLDQVTLRLSDGSSVGGSPVLMSAADLAARFASLRIRPLTSSRFQFTPRFGCPAFVPRSLHAQLVLRDGAGLTRTTLVVAPIR